MNAETDRKLNELLHQYVFITDPANQVTPEHNFLASRTAFDPIMAELARHRWEVVTTIKEDRSVVVRLKHPYIQLKYELTLNHYLDHAHIRSLALLALLTCGVKLRVIEQLTGMRLRA